jgi:hypothetical protein
LALALTAGGHAALAMAALAGPHDALIAKHAAANGVPEELVRRVIRIESRGNAKIVHRGNYGLMQIRLGTARGVGYSGDTDGLLDPDTNLTYAVKYLAGAYRAAGCDADRAVSYYQRGYYGAGKRECAASSSPLAQTVQAGTQPAAKPTNDAASAKPKAELTAIKPVDVLKPKVVRTETIASPTSGLTAARPVGNFEPARVAPPAAQPVAVAHPLPPKQESASKVDRVKPDAVEPPAKFELASIPLPPVRPTFEPAPKQAAQSLHRPDRARKRADRKPKADATEARFGSRSDTEPESKIDSKAKTDSKFKLDGPAGVVSFLKKLVTPDKKPRRAVEAQADPPPQAQRP